MQATLLWQAPAHCATQHAALVRKDAMPRRRPWSLCHPERFQAAQHTEVLVSAVVIDLIHTVHEKQLINFPWHQSDIEMKAYAKTWKNRLTT